MIDRIGKYRIDSILGRGTMGVVYKAIDETTNRPVAIKAIHPHLLVNTKAGADLARRLKSEATAATRRSHENIVNIYDCGQELDTFYIVMEFVKGYELQRLLQSQTPLPLECISDFFLAICAGLEYAHQEGVVHRNLKPGNILISEDDTVKITDFGLANSEGSDSSPEDAAYLAPEQCAGLPVDCRADIYALGIIAFELFTLCEDFPPILCQYSVACAPGTQQAQKIDPNIKLPQALTRFLDNCLNPVANRRFSNMGEMIEAYEAAIDIINKNAAPRTTGATRNQSAQAVAKPDIGFNFDLDPDFLETIRLKTTAASEAPAPAEAVAPEAPSAPADAIEMHEASTALELIRALKNIHPVLDHDWMERIPRLLKQLDDDTRRRCYKSILEPKGISLTNTGKLTFTSQHSLNHAKNSLTFRPLKALVDELLRVVNAMGKSRNIVLIGDALEAALNQINEIDTQDNLAQQKEKVFLTESFLYDFAIALRAHDFDVPENRRGLTVDMIKAYIIEVFIKQKILNYSFSPLPAREFKKDHNRFVSTELFDAVKKHRISIMPTEHYFFLVGEVSKAGQDLYSIRRFLTEEVAIGGRAAYYHGLALDRAELANSHYQEKVRLDIASLVDSQRQLHKEIVELVNGLDRVQSAHLLPLLMKPLDTNEANLHTVIEDRLRDYERNLCVYVLNKIARSLRETAKSADEFEFLFVNLKAFLLESLGDIHDFYYLAPARLSAKSQELEFKIAAYLRLMEKRKRTVFSSDRDAVLAKDDELNYRKPMDELITLVNKTIPVIQTIKNTLQEAQRQDAERTPKQKSWDTFLGRKFLEPKDVQQSLDQAIKESYLAIVNITKRYQKTTIHLEFEGLIAIDENWRHYALPRGEEGISLLPMLLRMPEDTRTFDIFAVKELLKPTLFRPLADRLLDAGDSVDTLV